MVNRNRTSNTYRRPRGKTERKRCQKGSHEKSPLLKKKKKKERKWFKKRKENDETCLMEMAPTGGHIKRGKSSKCKMKGIHEAPRRKQEVSQEQDSNWRCVSQHQLYPLRGHCHGWMSVSSPASYLKALVLRVMMSGRWWGREKGVLMMGLVPL